MIYEQDVPLNRFSTLGIGGPAKRFVRVKSEDELLRALQTKEPIFILAGGSNIVISDDGFPGLVIKNEIGDMAFDCSRAVVGAGVEWDAFVSECVRRELGGVENLSAIPGTVGAAPVQNIGAYGSEAKDTIAEVRAINRWTLEPIALSNEECGFGYRRSIFNTTDKNKYAITNVVFQLAPAEGLDTKRADIIRTRTAKGHIAPPRGPRSAGSFFKNPIVRGEKLFAAKLIEEAGFRKAERRGNVGISPFHALVLVTYPGATAHELLAFVEEIRAKVKNRFDIMLDIEPELVGF